MSLGHALRSGDERAFAEVYARFQKPVINFLMLRGCNPEIAAELSQEVFIKVMRYRAAFNPELEIATWLWEITRNTLIDWFRKNGPLALASETLGGQDGACDRLGAEELLIEETERRQVLGAVFRLPPRQRKALTLRLARVPYSRIARELGMSDAAARSLVKRARARLISAGKDAVKT